MLKLKLYSLVLLSALEDLLIGYWLVFAAAFVAVVLGSASIASGTEFDNTPQTRLTYIGHVYSSPIPVADRASVPEALAAFATDKTYLRVVELTSTQALQPIIAKCRNSIGRVVCSDRGGVNSIGSCTYLGESIVLTAAHVVRDAQRIYVDIGGEMIPARILSTGETDQCLLQLSRPARVAGIPLASNEVQKNETLFAAGFDGGRTLRFWGGRVVKFYGDESGPHAAAEFVGNNRGSVSGDSGGGVFNERGELVSNLWGSTGGNTFAVTNTSTRQFIAQNCVRFPILKAILGGTTRRVTGAVNSLAGCPGGTCTPQYVRPRYSQTPPAVSSRPIMPSQQYAPAPIQSAPELRLSPPTLPPTVTPPAGIVTPPNPGGIGYGIEPSKERLNELIGEQFAARRDELRGPPGKDGQPGRDGKSIDSKVLAGYATIEQVNSVAQQSESQYGQLMSAINGLSTTVDTRHVAVTNEVNTLRDRAGVVVREKAGGLLEAMGIPAALAAGGPIGIGVALAGWFLRRRLRGGDERPFQLMSQPMVQAPAVQPMAALPAPQVVAAPAPRMVAQTQRQTLPPLEAKVRMNPEIETTHHTLEAA